jgi:hypothetical protein
MRACTVLPVRFGSLFADETALSATLATHEAELRADLDRVRGRLELSLRVLWEQAAHATGRTTGGSTYRAGLYADPPGRRAARA